jgi:hypothetical protein
MQDNRRKHPRVDLDVQVNCDQFYVAQSKDVSEGGMCIVFGEEMDTGRMLDLRFSLPGSDRLIHVFGKVQWARRTDEGRFATGVSFWNLDADDKAVLSNYLKSGVA